MPLSAGTRLGAYEITGSLGAGGMGEVYRAKDIRLNRQVAIKVLPDHLATDAAARARFVREGQALAALSHPNLVALYDVGTEGSTSFAVMELVDGETLQTALVGGRLPLRRVIDYGVQIARGLAAAHDKGIVHRDLKPSNVMIAADGRVRILDFGLARASGDPRALGQSGDAETVPQATDPGVVMGTVGYMSPEQVRGLGADARSDIFTFGTVLYEMISGRRAFQRETAAETMTAILKDDPASFAMEIAAPPAFDHIIRHCLEKRPDDRFRSAADLAFQLETLTSASGRVEAIASTADTRPRRINVLPIAAALLLGFLLGGFLLMRWSSARAVPNAVARTTLLTYSGLDHSPATSPDGKMIAFVSSRDATSRIWLRQLATGEEAALTAGRDTAPRFSPDGATILFTRYEGPASSLYRVPIVGGQARKVLDQATEGDWSSDGSQLAFTRQRPGGDWVTGIAAGDGSNARESSALTTSLKGPRWSPDNRSFVVIQSGSSGTIQDRILKYDAGTLSSSPVEALDVGGLMSTPTWSSNDALVYAQSSDVTSYTPESRVVLRQLSGGGRTVAWLPTFAGGLDLLADGSIVFDTSSARQNLREATWTSGGLTGDRWLTRGTSTERQPSYSPDGKWIVFSATRNGNLDLWVTSPETGETRRLTDDKAQDWDPGFTRDGKHLLWSSNRSGVFEIWMAEADGRNARQLTHDGIDAENPTSTRHDEWIVYGAGSAPTEGLWKIRPDGSAATQLVTGGNAHPDVSPDGQYVLYHSNVVGNGRVHVVRVSDGQPVIPPIDIASTVRMTSTVSVGRGRWRPDGRAILYVAADATGSPCLYEQAFIPGQDTTKTRRVLQRSEVTIVIESFGVSPDGKHITTSFVEDQLALMRIDGLAGLTRPVRK